MSARSDQPTIVNLAQHTYWNLAGHHAGSILDHLVHINASHYMPVDHTLITTGEIHPVENTPFDFSKPKKIRENISAMENAPIGFDHNYVIEGPLRSNRLTARVEEPLSGRTLEVYPDMPGVQFYTGNSLNGSQKGKQNASYSQHAGL